MFLKAISKVVTNLNFLLGLLIVTAIGVALQQYYFSDVHAWNAEIFKMSYYDLVNHTNPYIGGHTYKGLNLDLFKYSPSFAFLYAPLAIMPLWANLATWNLLNLVLFFFAIKSLPFNDIKKSIIIWLALPELILSTQNSQCNVLIAALLILGFTALENKNLLLATLCIVLTVYIKLFGAIAFLLFLFYPNKFKAILYTLMWGLIIFLLPLLTVPFNELLNIYKEWGVMLKQDNSISWGLSAMGIIGSWLSIDKTIIQAIGLILLCIPLIRTSLYPNTHFRLLYLCSVLIWVVTFNHRAESASYVIAVTAMAIWLVMQNPKSFLAFTLILAIVITSFAHSDILPLSFKANYIIPYNIKGIPSFIMWIVLQFNIFKLAFKPSPLQAQGSTGVLQK
jgi:hypothetical protein